MVMEVKTIAQNLWEGFLKETEIFTAIIFLPEPPDPGLYTYNFLPEGGQTRIHLRIEEDGSGVLFRDVTDVIHLNQTGAEMAKMALDEVPLGGARSGMMARYKGVNKETITTELGRIYKMIDGMRYPGPGCPTCAIDDLKITELFSTPVQAPYKVDLALTYGCNNQCPHCYNEPSRYPMTSLRKEDWFQVIDILNKVGVPHLIMTGGEATLHPDLPEIVHYANSLGHIVGLNTNGRRMAHQDYVNTLVNSGLNHVQITLGSCHPGVHDALMGAKSFEQTVRGIKNAIAGGIHTITNTTLMRANMDHVEDLITFIHKLGIRTFAMNGMIYSGGGFANSNAIPEDEMPPLLIRVRDKAEELNMRFLWYTPTEYCRMSPVELDIGAKRCNAGEYSLCVEPNGDVLPCQSYYVSAGNILSDPWDTFWRGDLFRSFREREDDPQLAGLPEKCWECPDLSLCGGGCRIEREAREGFRTTHQSGQDSFAGCSGGCSTRSQFGRKLPMDQHAIGFRPSNGTIQTKIRGTGEMEHFIPIGEIGTYTS